MSDAIGASTVGITIKALNPIFQSNFEIQIESTEDFDSIDAQCKNYLERSYSQVRTTKNTRIVIKIPTYFPLLSAYKMK